MQKKFCAHKGLSGLIPENSLPAFAAAVTLGADELEFDVRLTKDDRMIVSHDPVLENISDGTGRIQDYTLEELMRLNIGIQHGWQVPFCTPEELFAHFANTVTFNIHIKEMPDYASVTRQLTALIEQYHAQERVYFAGTAGVLPHLKQHAPHIPRVAIHNGPWEKGDVLAVAQKNECVGVQLWTGYFDETTVRQYHERGMFCNVFFADDLPTYDKFYAMGIDTILTNRMDLAAHYKKNNFQ